MKDTPLAYLTCVWNTLSGKSTLKFSWHFFLYLNYPDLQVLSFRDRTELEGTKSGSCPVTHKWEKGFQRGLGNSEQMGPTVTLGRHTSLRFGTRMHSKASVSEIKNSSTSHWLEERIWDKEDDKSKTKWPVFSLNWHSNLQYSIQLNTETSISH